MTDTDTETWAREVRAILLTLSPGERTALRLVYFEQLTQLEAAERSGISARSISTFVLTGMTALAAALAA